MQQGKEVFQIPYYTKEEIEKARQMDLLTYLQNYEPRELVYEGRGNYCTRTHDSLKISNGKWMWWSRGFGGVSALDYLIKVREYPFTEAVGMILGREAIKPPIFMPKKIVEEKKKLLLPQKGPNNNRVKAYLMHRGIDDGIIEHCIEAGLIYESLPYHNCIFVGFDSEGAARYASYCATIPERVMGDAAGSDKRFSFRIQGGGDCLHVFESAIDLLSYATMQKLSGGDWRKENLLSLGGVYAPASADSPMKVPAALENWLKEGTINEIVFHLDNDFAGREATKRLTEKLQGKYKVRDESPLFGKDCNDELRQYKRQLERTKGVCDRDEGR